MLVSASPSPSATPDPLSDFTHTPGTELTPSGLDWQAVTDIVVTDGVRLSNITAWAGGFVAVEWRRQPPHGVREAAIWRSADGRTWKRSRLPSRVQHIWELLPFQGGLVLASQSRGYDRDGFALDIWRSTDGAVWRRIGEVGAPRPVGLGDEWRIWPTALVATAGHLSLIAMVAWSIGSGGSTPFGSRIASIGDLALTLPTHQDLLLGWTSLDGAEWVRRPVTGILDAEGHGSIDLVMSTPEGLRAIRIGGRQVVLASRDGLTWRNVAPLPRDYEWGGSEGLLWADGAPLLISDSGKQEGSEGCGNRLGTWWLGDDGGWDEVLDRQPAFVYGAAAEGTSLVLVGYSWCRGDDEWAWILVSSDGGRTWDPGLSWTGAPGSCLYEVAIRDRTVVMLGCAPDQAAPATAVPAIWTADLPPV